MIGVTWANDTNFDVCMGIREAVFVREQGFSLADERDEADGYAFHALLTHDGVPCATGRVFEEEDGVFHIGRVAVLREYRGKHLGDMLMRVLMDKALQEGAREIRLGSQLHAIGFYEKLGFVNVGEDFLDAGSPHAHMTITREGVMRLFDCEGCERRGACAAMRS